MLSPQLKSALAEVLAADQRADRVLADLAAAQQNVTDLSGAVEAAKQDCNTALTKLGNAMSTSAKLPS